VVEKSRLKTVLERGLATSKPVQLKFDPLIFRGFLYYTSTVFEIFDTSPENPRSIAGGGRYDNLVGLFGGKPIPGIGFGMGDVTLIDFLHTHGIAPAPRTAPTATVLTPDPALGVRLREIARDLRARGIVTTTPVEPRKLGKSLERASKEGVRFAVIAGGDELARGAVKLRDLSRSEEREVLLGALAQAILDGQEERR
jgi:histidyl-tRNA synthetase